MQEKKISPIGESWSDYRQKHYTEEELAKSDLMTEIIGELIKAREEKELSQRELEKRSGIKQPMIARIEKGNTDPRLSTLTRLLKAMGLKLTVIPDGKITNRK